MSYGVKTTVGCDGEDCARNEGQRRYVASAELRTELQSAGWVSAFDKQAEGEDRQKVLDFCPECWRKKPKDERKNFRLWPGRK